MDTTEPRRAMVEAGLRLGARGLVSAGEGNLSIRLPDGQLLVTPSGARKDELRADDLLTVPPERPSAGDAPATDGRRATSDVAIHRAVLAARPDVGAVAHAHLPASMALTLAGERPEPALLPETALFIPHLPVVPFAEMGSDVLAARVAAAFMGEGPPGVVLLERHGAVAVGDAALGGANALGQAVDRLELVEVLCRAWRDALLLRAARAIVGPGWPRG